MIRRAFLRACVAVAVCFTSLVPDLAPRDPGPPESVKITSAIDLATGWVTDFCIDGDGAVQILRMWHCPHNPSVLALDGATRRVLVIPKRHRKPSWPAAT